MKKPLLSLLSIFALVVVSFLFFTSFFDGSEEIEDVACPMDAKLCPDGSAVGRTAPNCEFAPCPDVRGVPNEPTKTIPVPLERATERVTKKPYGIFIDPESSPIQPERFRGYHTGADFEIFPGEEGSVVLVRAICSGPILEKRDASGYGGVVVTSCNLENETVTVVYGHLALSSVSFSKGELVREGEVLGHLGQGLSVDTDGERKHLHLALRKRETLDLRGYVGSERELDLWIDPMLTKTVNPLFGTLTFSEPIDDVAEHIRSKSDLIVLERPKRDETIASPVMLQGRARGSWFFEGSFPIVIVDWDGRIVGEGRAEAQGEWMTDGFVPFQATISYVLPADTPYRRGAVILRKDNPSGLPEHDDALEIPVQLVLNKPLE